MLHLPIDKIFSRGILDFRSKKLATSPVLEDGKISPSQKFKKINIKNQTKAR
jgi:hypothetical protein